MVTKENIFEGIPVGAVTTANSGSVSGTAFDAVAGSVTVSDLSASVGTQHGYRTCTATLSTSMESYVAWNVSGSDHYIRMYFYTTPVTHNKRMVYAGTVASTTSGWDIRQIVSSEVIGVCTRNTTRFQLGVNGDGTGALVQNKLYRVEAHITATAIEARLYDGTTGVLIDSDTYSGTVDAGITQIKFGDGNGVNQSSTVIFDSIGYSDSAWLGALSGNQPPVATAPADFSANELTVVNLVGSSSDPDGTISSHLWEQLSGTAVTLNNSTTATANFTAPDVTVPTVLSFRYTVTDNGGLTAVDTVDVTILPVTAAINYYNTFDGLSNATAITPANSGGSNGSAFASTSGDVLTTSTEKVHGANALRATLALSTESFVAWEVDGAVHYLRAYFKTDAFAVTHNKRMIWNGTAGSTTFGWDIRQIVAEEIVGICTRNTTRVWLGINGGGTGQLARNTWYRVEAEIITGASGSIKGRLYDINGTLLDEGTYNGNVDAATLIKYGVGNGSNINSVIDMDSIGYSNQNWLGAFVPPNVAPTVNAGLDLTDVEPGTLIVLNGVASEIDGDIIVSRNWVQLSGTAVVLEGAGNSRTFIAPYTVAGDTSVFEFSATDDGGLTGTDTVSVTTLPATERAVSLTEGPVEIRDV